MSLDYPATRNPLLVPDLLQCILDYFPIPEGMPDCGLFSSPSQALEDLRVSQRALAALARTCRALSEPSLDRLWYRLHTLIPIFLCFTPAVEMDRARVSYPHYNCVHNEQLW